MKKYLYGMLAGVAVLFTSCTSILDKEPLDAVYGSDVWNNAQLLRLYLNGLYPDYLPAFAATTNAAYSDDTPGGDDYMYGQLTKESEGTFSDTYYANIRKINILLDSIGGSAIAEEERRTIEGEARFLRAYAYWNLVLLYGGVPMVMNVQQFPVTGEVTPELLISRNKTSECIDLIVKDLNVAIDYLPRRWATDYGRATKAAAAALKGRVLLFYASPQFTNDVDGVPERWKAAYDANRAAIDTCLVSGNDLNTSFTDLFVNCKENTSEAVFVRLYTSSVSGYWHTYDKGVRPVSAKGNGKSNLPTWNLVKAFPMKDGYPITETGGTYKYDSLVFWVNRDPRLAATVAWNGCLWPLNGREVYAKAGDRSSKKTTTRQWIFTGDGENGIGYEEYATGNKDNNPITGFYCRKFINPTLTENDLTRIGTDWMEIRFAEVVLNFAECANEIGQKEEAIESLRKIRNRPGVEVGMGNISIAMTKEQLREVIMNERRIEFAFENKRHFDLRRRNMYAWDLGDNIRRLNGTSRIALVTTPKAPYTSSTLYARLDTMTDACLNNPACYGRYFKVGIKSLETNENYPTINYLQPEYNFYAIQQTNVDKNPNLHQNIHWGGDFDPYE
jgi:hypothetical protein